MRAKDLNFEIARITLKFCGIGSFAWEPCIHEEMIEKLSCYCVFKSFVSHSPSMPYDAIHAVMLVLSRLNHDFPYVAWIYCTNFVFIGCIMRHRSIRPHWCFCAGTATQAGLLVREALSLTACGLRTLREPSAVKISRFKTARYIGRYFNNAALSRRDFGTIE